MNIIRPQRIFGSRYANNAAFVGPGGGLASAGAYCQGQHLHQQEHDPAARRRPAAWPQEETLNPPIAARQGSGSPATIWNYPSAQHFTSRLSRLVRGISGPPVAAGDGVGGPDNSRATMLMREESNPNAGSGHRAAVALSPPPREPDCLLQQAVPRRQLGHVPVPVTEDQAVSFRYVANGLYARAGGRTNSQEAKAVVAERPSGCCVGRYRAAGGAPWASPPSTFGSRR
jgi:hypothetical protein